MKLSEIAKKHYKMMVDKGFHENKPDRYMHTLLGEWVTVKLALIHSEVSEALEVVRKKSFFGGTPKAFSEELADVILRTLDLSESLNIDIEQVLKDKMEKNRERPYKHGKEF